MIRSPRPVSAAAVVFAAVALALTGAVAPASALAAAARDSISVNLASAGRPADMLEISLTADSPITGLSAQLNGTGGNTASMAVTSFTPPAPGASSGIWTSASPIPWGSGTGELPLGIYAVQVTVSDQGGTTLSDAPAPGYFDLLIEPSLTFGASPTTVDYGHRSVTFSGAVTGTNPDGSTAPLQGAVVTISPAVGGTGDSSFTATTGTDGSYTVTAAVLTGDWQASVTTAPADVDPAANTLQLVSLTVTPDKISLTATAAKRDVNYRKPDTVSGTVMFKSGSIWLPLPDYQVVITGTRPDDGGVTTSTNAAGHFTATLADLKTSDRWTISAGRHSAYFIGSSTTKTITVNWPAAITRVSERLSPFGVLSASGCIVYKVPNGQDYQSTAPLWVQYAPRPGGPWRELGKMPATWNGTQMCPAVGANWVRHFGVPLANAWYREQIKAAPGIEPATSKPVHRWKYPTRIVRFRVSSHSVPAGGSLTVSGRLQQHIGRWRPLRHHVVLIVLRPKGKSRWFRIAKSRTTASGHFSVTVTDPVSARWSAVFGGGILDFACQARVVYVSVGSS